MLKLKQGQGQNVNKVGSSAAPGIKTRPQRNDGSNTCTAM